MKTPDSQRLISAPVRTAIIIIIAALTAVAAAACNDDDGTQDTATATATPQDGSPPPTAGSDAGEFEQLAATYIAGAEGRVVYAIDSLNFGVHPRGTWVTYRRDGEVREDWTQDASGYEETNVAIIAKDGFFFCQQTPFIVNCSEQPSATELEVVTVLFTTIKDFPAELLSGAAEYTVEELPDETIAGRTASCFSLDVDGRIGGGPDGTEQVKLCYADDGTLLKMERTITFDDPAFEGAWMTVIAQETGDAAETDFDLPSSPTPPQA